MGNSKNGLEFDFDKKVSWNELYALTEHWLSDLEFYRDDLRFLYHLIDKYFIWIVKTENLKLVKVLKNGLIDLNKKSKDLLDKVGRHRIRLGYMIENQRSTDARICKMRHKLLEDEITQFVESFRGNRKEVFAITEYIIDNEELSNIIGS